MIPSGTQFIGFSDSVNLTERRSASVNAETAVYTIDDIRGYKVYTALLTQSGEEEELSQASGAVEQGVSYFIGTPKPGSGWDFSNVGGPIWPDMTPFVANSNNTPNNYGSATLVYNTGAPVVTVLEDNIGNIWFTYEGIGNYNINSNSSENFNSAKTFVILTNNLSGNHGIIEENMALGFECYSNGTITLTTAINDAYLDGVLFNTPIEIRVYN